MELRAPAAIAPDAPTREPLVRFAARQGALPLGALFGGLTALGALAVELLHLDRLGFTVCMLKATTGIPCPTCGGTRTLGHLAHFDLAGALAMNPLVALGALLLVPWAVADVLLLRRGRALEMQVAPRARPLVLLAGLAALGLNWLYLLSAGR